MKNNRTKGSDTHSFMVRFLIIFIPLAIFMVLMVMAGITDNLLMTIILCLAFVWMLQSIYKMMMRRRKQNRNKYKWNVKRNDRSLRDFR